jgi:hypothetical protein
MMVGALDGVDDEEIASLHDPDGSYPIHIPAGRPSGVDVPREWIAPYLQRAINTLCDRGASAVAILCAGDLGSYEAPVPILSSGSMTPAILRAAFPGAHVGVVTPNRGQLPFAVAKWRSAGFEASARVVAPYQADKSERLLLAARELAVAGATALVLDCFGFSADDARDVQRATGLSTLAARDVAARTIGVFCASF